MQTGANRITIADGNTINSSQIRLIAKSFMGTEEDLYDLCMRFNASYVVIDFWGELTDRLYGEYHVFGISYRGRIIPVGKWTAIATIALGEDFKPEEYLTSDDQGRVFPSDKAMNVTIFKLVLSAFEYSELELFKPIYLSPNRQVLIFKVLRQQE